MSPARNDLLPQEGMGKLGLVPLTCLLASLASLHRRVSPSVALWATWDPPCSPQNQQETAKKVSWPFSKLIWAKNKTNKKQGFPLGFPCKNTPPKLEPSCLFGLKIPPSAQGLKSAALLVDGHRSKTGVSHGYPFRWTNRVGQQGNGVAFRVVSTWLSGLG